MSSGTAGTTGVGDAQNGRELGRTGWVGGVMSESREVAPMSLVVIELEDKDGSMGVIHLLCLSRGDVAVG